MTTLLFASYAAVGLLAAAVPAANARDFHNGSTLAGNAAGTLTQQSAPYSH